MCQKQKLILLATLLVVTITCFAQPRPTAAQDPASEIIVLINQFRAELGLSAFTGNGTLSIAAQQQATYMAQTNNYAHNWPSGSTPQTRANNAGYNGRVVENIVGGWHMTPRQGLIWWQNSPVHYNTITSSRYTEIGAGYAVSGDQTYYAIVVGSPGGTPRTNGTSNSEQPEPVRVIPIVLSEPREDGSLVHPVQDGQSLWMLAAHYDVPLSELLYLNSLGENDFISPGDEIYIRLAEGQAPPPTPTPPFTHIVKKDETPWSIAARYDLTIADFLWYNSLPQDVILRPGDEVIIRLREGQAPPPTPTPQLTYKVQSGDTPLGIAGRFNITLDQLLTLNNLPSAPLLQIGQELFIRPTVAPPAPTSTPTAVATEPPPPTATPESVAQVNTAVPTATATATRPPSPTPTPTTDTAVLPSTSNLSGNLMGLGVVILVAVGVVAVVMRRQQL